MDASSKGSNFVWTKDTMKILIDVCLQYQRKYGRNQKFQWPHILGEFEKISGKKASQNTMKNKYDTMKKDYRAWIMLLQSDTGLGWNASTRTICADDFWWEQKLKKCIGCIDGTHIDACIPEKGRTTFRNRKGMNTFNVMAVCDFDMCFTFVCAGWKGSAHDSKVFNHVLGTPSLHFPHPPLGKYYLVDKGYPEKEGYLVPYPNTRYHEAQFENEEPKDYQEAFNRSHSSLRSCIERCFGVLKSMWKILKRMPKFDIPTQAKIIVATCALHNYIQRYSNGASEEDEYNGSDNEGAEHEPLPNSSSNPGEDEPRGMRAVREEIAAMIWNAHP